MKIVFAGGGSGGHFYPIIAIAEEINAIILEKRLVGAKLYYFADKPFDERALFEQNIVFKEISAGKLRYYRSIWNFFDLFKTGVGCIRAFIKLFFLYPDIVFGKGGYVSFPVLLSARILGIPVFIHESDSIPGRVNAWAGKFARRIAVSYPEAARYFPPEKTAHTGNPIRQEILHPSKEGAAEFLNLDPAVPTILVLGGSQGAATLNDVLIDILPGLLNEYQIIHQVGTAHEKETAGRAHLVLENHPHKDRYKSFGFLDTGALRMAAGISSLVITRAGSTIFEVASWGVPAIVVPIDETVSHDQRTNALLYAEHGAGVLLEEKNLSSHILESQVNRILKSPDLQKSLSEKAREFARPDAARKIAEEIISIALKHEI